MIQKKDELLAAKKALMSVLRSFVLQLELLGLNRTEIAESLQLPRSSLADALGETKKMKKLETLETIVERAAQFLHFKVSELGVLPGNGTKTEVGAKDGSITYVLERVTPILVSAAEAGLVLDRTELLIQVLGAHMNYVLQLQDEHSKVQIKNRLGEGVRELELILRAYRVESPDTVLQMNQSTREFVRGLTERK